MLRQLNAGNRSSDDHRSVIRRELYEKQLNSPSAWRRASGSFTPTSLAPQGVAEIPYALVPLTRDAGLDTHWGVFGAEPLVNVTKAFHDALLGAPYGLRP